MGHLRRFLVSLFLLIVPASLAGQGLDTSKIDQALGRSGQKLGEVYKVGFPRADLHVVLSGIVIRPGFALGSWAAFAGNDDASTVMGDLVLLQNEVNPVMESLSKSGFAITALHNHLLNETPHVMYMHYMGHGKAAELAAALKSALSSSKTPLGKPSPPAKTAEPPFVATVEQTLDRKGSFNAGVLSYGIPRADPVSMGRMTIPPSMGVAEAINFQEAATGEVATTGDFVLTGNEVNPVISALEQHHILVTALHNHMLDEQPRLFFVHFWGVGTPQAVAEGIKVALEKVRTK